MLAPGAGAAGVAGDGVDAAAVPVLGGGVIGDGLPGALGAPFVAVFPDVVGPGEIADACSLAASPHAAALTAAPSAVAT
jgi:hypothetical protein